MRIIKLRDSRVEGHVWVNVYKIVAIWKDNKAGSVLRVEGLEHPIFVAQTVDEVLAMLDRFLQ